MTSQDRFKEIARHSDYKPFDGETWRATWSDCHKEWQIWGSWNDGPSECIGYGPTQQDAWTKALFTFESTAV